MSEFIDRRIRLVVLGILSILVGGLSGLLALLVALLPLIDRLLPQQPSMPVDLRSSLIESFFLVSAGAAFVWLGIGSLRARRWVRPLMLILAWTWLLSGVMGLGLVLVTLDPLFDETALGVEPLPAEALLLVKLATVGLVAVAGLILPAVFVWGYQSRDVQRTSEALHPEPAWTDRCPISVLGLSIGLAAAAYLALPSAALAPVPWFGRLLSGWPAALLTLLVGVACAYLAWSTYRLEPAGWWGSTVLCLLIGVSTAATFFRVELVEFYRALGYPESQLELMRPYLTVSRWWPAGLALLFTVACVGYMIYVRRYFNESEGARAR